MKILIILKKLFNNNINKTMMILILKSYLIKNHLQKFSQIKIYD
jgi:hypothetical protein